MEQARQVVFKVFHGPNIVTPFAAVSIDYQVPFSGSLSPQIVTKHVDTLLTSEFTVMMQLPADGADFTTILAATATALQDLMGRTGLPRRIDRRDNGSACVSIGFYDVDTAATALQCGYDLATAIFTKHAVGDAQIQRLRAVYKRAVDLSKGYQPDKNTLRLIRVAGARDIPVTSFAPGSRVWMYGYGARAVRFWKAVAQDESFVGTTVAKDKVWSQRLLQRAGFPGVQFGIADNVQSAREVARQIGYPVVTKPTDGSGGHGVTVGIGSDKELEAGFVTAQTRSRAKTVQIEKFIAGDHCRLTVLGGTLVRAALFKPAQVLGDGSSKLLDLIRAENALRAEQNSPAQEVRQIEIDTALTTLLARQGFKLDDTPPEGARVLLRQASNITMGGRLYDITGKIHPDNVDLAQAVARVLGICGMGMDLISQDVTKSWHDTECAIIDINCPYGMTADSLAQKALAEVFPPNGNGRIPCIMIVGNDPNSFDAIVSRIENSGLRVGRADANVSIAGHGRFGTQPGWPGRIMALLLDPACEVLVTMCSPRDIEDFGLPHVRFDLAFVADGAALQPAIDRLLNEHVGKVIALDRGAALEETALPAVSLLIDSERATVAG